MLDSEAVRLFENRAAQARVGFSIDESNAETVAQICRDLDGLPLAIELSAARLKTLSVNDLAERLSDRFGLLTVGTRTALSRHKTLRAVVEWSYELLDENERRLFAILSVFAGGFNLAAAEAVAEPDFETLDILDSLVDQSLVIAEIRNGSEARYRLLETLRRYGDSVLVDRDAVAARHAGFYSRLVEEAHQKLRTDPKWYDRLDRNLDNLRKAIGWALRTEGESETAARSAVALREFWQVRGHWREAQRWMDQCLEQTDRLPARLVGQLNHAAGVISALRRDYERAFPHLEAALRLFREANEPGDIADALLDLSQAAARHGDYARAESLLSESRTLYEEGGNQTGAAEACCVLAQVAVFRGDYENAGRQGQEAKGLFEKLGDQYGKAWVLSILGERAYSHDDLDEAADFFRSAATLAEEIDIPQFVANGLQGLGDVESARGDQQKARRLLNESLRINRKIGDTLFVAGVLGSFAEVAARQGDHERAARLWGIDEHLRAELGGMPPRRRGGRYDRDFKELQKLTRKALGEQRFEEALQAGARSSIDQVLA
jgi:non-specific serine/threonine protein kinase